jgi:hypothetical protein
MAQHRFSPLWICLVLLGSALSGCRHQATTTLPGTGKTFTSNKSHTTYAYTTVPNADEKFEKVEAPAPGILAPNPDDFRGTDRKAAKTSLTGGPPEEFQDVAALLQSPLLVPDSKMLKHKPPISKDATSDRVAEEQHNVTITGFLYASTKESDNDFHCIVGTSPDQPKKFLNVEVSGLPESGAFRAPLKSVRDAFQEFFGDNIPAGSGYSKFNPPIKVRITGSIFFDVDHKAGVIGPAGFRPKTAWEIHPVSEIVFEP